MRPSASSTERRRALRRGYTLVEVAIAASLFALMLTIVLQQFSDTTNINKTQIARADLRRVGERVLTGIADDVRSTNTINCSMMTVNANAQVLELYKTTGYDTMPAAYIREQDSNNIDILRRYSQSGTSLNFYHRALTGSKGGAIPGSPDNPTAVLLSELDTAPNAKNQDGSTQTSGFNLQVTPGPVPASVSTNLLSGATPAWFTDVPQTLTITLNLRRNVGGNATGQDIHQINSTAVLAAVVTMEARVQIRATASY